MVWRQDDVIPLAHCSEKTQRFEQSDNVASLVRRGPWRCTYPWGRGQKEWLPQPMEGHSPRRGWGRVPGRRWPLLVLELASYSGTASSDPRLVMRGWLASGLTPLCICSDWLIRLSCPVDPGVRTGSRLGLQAQKLPSKGTQPRTNADRGEEQPRGVWASAGGGEEQSWADLAEPHPDSASRQATGAAQRNKERLRDAETVCYLRLGLPPWGGTEVCPNT